MSMFGIKNKADCIIYTGHFDLFSTDKLLNTV